VRTTIDVHCNCRCKFQQDIYTRESNPPFAASTLEQRRCRPSPQTPTYRLLPRTSTGLRAPASSSRKLVSVPSPTSGLRCPYAIYGADSVDCTPEKALVGLDAHSAVRRECWTNANGCGNQHSTLRARPLRFTSIFKALAPGVLSLASHNTEHDLLLPISCTRRDNNSSALVCRHHQAPRARSTSLFEKNSQTNATAV
jgi:hypothetical protein